MNPLEFVGGGGSGGGGAAKTLWKPVTDPNSGRTYYVNRNTKETRWDKPADADQPWVEGGRTEEQQLPVGWVQHFDPKKQKPYYHNVATGETSWRRPVACVLQHLAPEAPFISCCVAN